MSGDCCEGIERGENLCECRNKWDQEWLREEGSETSPDKLMR